MRQKDTITLFAPLTITLFTPLTITLFAYTHMVPSKAEGDIQTPRHCPLALLPPSQTDTLTTGATVLRMAEGVVCEGVVCARCFGVCEGMVCA